MKRIQDDSGHKYLAIPMEYPISDNEAHSTYDTFLKLRDTIIYSSKVYADNAWRSLIIGVKTDWNPTWTIEIWRPNIFRQDIQPSWPLDPIIKWTYIKEHPDGCEIVLKWRYRITHKEQLERLQTTQINRVTWYVLQKKKDWIEIKRAVFDWAWDTIWEMKRMTSFGTIDVDLDKGDVLELHVIDQDDVDIPTSIWQPDSNRWSIEYLDLPYKD